MTLDQLIRPDAGAKTYPDEHPILISAVLAQLRSSPAGTSLPHRCTKARRGRGPEQTEAEAVNGLLTFDCHDGRAKNETEGNDAGDAVCRLAPWRAGGRSA